MKRTFVIGDVHGHIESLLALLTRAGFLQFDGDLENVVVNPLDPDVEIVQLGDLGHFGHESGPGDEMCYQWALNLGMIVLWGNHDRAVVQPETHWFRGFHAPISRMFSLLNDVKPRWAHAAHGYLMTHAGIGETIARGWPTMTVEEAAARLPGDGAPNQIGCFRGGPAQFGGMLWRDDREPLWMGVPQIYGHTRGDIRVRVQRCVPMITEDDADLVTQYSYCIDVAGHSDGNLAGIWLPEMKVVAVGPDAEEFETTINEVTQ